VTRYAILLGGASLAAMIAQPAHGQAHRGAFPSNPPANAAPGECYQRIRHDAQYNTIRETYVAADGYEVHEVYVNGQLATEPVLRADSQQYLAREAGVRYRVTEPVYETVTERVKVQPAYSRYEVVPARHETVTERVLVKEAQLVWKRGHHPKAKSVRHDPETGEIWCLVEEPAQYRTIERTVLTEPSRVVEIPVEAQYATISREVLVQEATVEEIPIEAKYASYDYQVLAHPAEVRSRQVERRMASYERHEMVSGERFEWVRVECAELGYSYGHGGSKPHMDKGGHDAAPEPHFKDQPHGPPDGDDPHALPDYSDRPVADAGGGQRYAAMAASYDARPTRSYSYIPADGE